MTDPDTTCLCPLQCSGYGQEITSIAGGLRETTNWQFKQLQVSHTSLVNDRSHSRTKLPVIVGDALKTSSSFIDLTLRGLGLVLDIVRNTYSQIGLVLDAVHHWDKDRCVFGGLILEPSKHTTALTPKISTNNMLFSTSNRELSTPLSLEKYTHSSTL